MKWIAILLLFTASLAQAEVYKCTSPEGRTSFSDKPCGDNAEIIEIKDSSGGVSFTGNGDWSKIEESNKEREIERAIKRHQSTISRLQRERDSELDVLRRQQSRANNNLAGATYRQSLATEMQAISDDYNARIAMEREAIQNLRSQQ